MNKEKIENEKSIILKEINALLDSYNTKNFDGIVSRFSKTELSILFGTDSSEVVNSYEEWEAFVKNDLMIDEIRFNNIRHLSIQVSDNLDLATSFFEDDLKLTIMGNPNEYIIRIAITWKKELSEWKIVQWLACFPTQQLSTDDLLNKQ